MTQLRAIEIDLDVHKLIEAQRLSFDETPNQALRRLLGLDDAGTSPAPASLTTDSLKSSWSAMGVVLPHGTALRMSYNGRHQEGQIIDGEWIVDGKAYNSPSGAAGSTSITRSGKKPNLDGWKYWEVKRPGEKWVPIKTLRPNLTLKDLGL
jgi:hypothetical protein